MELLSWIGVGLQVVGLVVTGFGIAATWREFATESLFEPIAVPSRRVWAWVKSRLLGRPVPVPEASGRLPLTVSATGRGFAPFRTLPKDQMVAESISELDERTRDLLKQLKSLDGRMTDEAKALRAEIDSARRTIETELETLRHSDREVATSGIRWEATGLALVALGVVFHAFGSFGA